MTKIELFGFAVLAATLAGCAAETTEAGGADAVGEEVMASESALTSATAGHQTGLVGRWRINGTSVCSAVFIPDATLAGGDSTWVLTNQQCVTDTDPTVYSVVSATGLTANVDKIYYHPIAEWNLGNVGNYGKVDIVLAHLTSTLNLNAPPVVFSNTSTTRSVFQESAMMNGTWAFSYDTGQVTENATYFTRIDVDIPSESGDAGGPIWQPTQSFGRWALEGISSAAGGASHAFGFSPWLRDALTCGAFDTSDPDPDFCSPGCECGVGEGDCDSDFDCRYDLVCGNNNGALVGLPSDYDVCVKPTSRQSSSTSGYCGSIGDCQIYEGDCDSHDDCYGDLICRPNVGYAIGESEATDVCDLPRMPGTKVFNNNKDTGSNHCTVDEPCGLGDGDCDPNNHATCRGFLKCKANVGSHFGFSSNNVDVCIHPDFY